MVRCRNTGFYAVDVFDANSGERLASIDLRHRLGEDPVGWMSRYFQFLENRWLAITLDEELREILLFDFEPHFQGK